MAVLAEPMAITIHQVIERCGISCSDYVLITGTGTIGILSAFIAKLAGAEKVIITGISSGEYCQFEAAKKLGADVIVNVDKDNLNHIILKYTQGRGIDVVIETSGADTAIAQGIND